MWTQKYKQIAVGIPPYMQRLPKFASWALIWAFTCFTFFTASADFFTSPPPSPLLFTNLSMSGHARVGLYAGAHPAGERARATVCYYRREGEARLFQGTPPELMFHTCAQCSTLYRASQVHCINCGRNHFIVGVLPLLCLFSGVRSITQYSHRNCF